MARERSYNSGRRGSSRRSSSSKSRWEPEYRSCGQMYFAVSGFVQKIIEDADNERDFVKFIIDNPYVEGNYNEICVEVPWEGFQQLEEGYMVNVRGNIRSWFNGKDKPLSYSFVAYDIEVTPFPNKQSEKTRRGIVTKDELFGEE